MTTLVYRDGVPAVAMKADPNTGGLIRSVRLDGR